MHLRSISLLLRLVSDLRPTPSYYAPYTLNKSQNNVVLLSFKLEGGLKAGISTGIAQNSKGQGNAIPGMH